MEICLAVPGSHNWVMVGSFCRTMIQNMQTLMVYWPQSQVLFEYLWFGLQSEDGL